MKKVYINESKLHLLNEENDKKEVTFYEFFVNAKNFLKDLLNKPSEAQPSELFKERGISKSELLNKMKDIGLIKCDEKITEVAVEESKGQHPFGKKMVAKRFVQYKVPKSRFEDKMKALYKDIFNESFDGKNIQIFKDSDKLINDMLDMDYDGAYKNRGGYDKEIVNEEGQRGATSCGNVMQGGGSNPDAGQFITPVSPTQRRNFWKPAMKRNKDEKNGSMTMNRLK